MQLKAPEPFTFEGGDRAVLLLHGFTGNTADVRMLGRFLEEKGYSSHAPLYKGHGSAPPEELMNSTPEDWWKSVLEGYQLLKKKGYEKIAVIGISLGGVFSLKLATEVPLAGVVPMCAPMGFKNKETLPKMVRAYAKQYKELEGKTEEQITSDLSAFQDNSMPAVEGLKRLVSDVSTQLHKITVPTCIVQGRLDDVIDMESPQIIYNGIKTANKEIKWYENSGHIITLEDERNSVEEDVFQFLDQLNWENVEQTIPPLQETKAPQIWW
ncbi:alpha/beta hydrolase [Neobacillus sp. GCM10023253]|uniref:alpha/beta hydrolase n=1 Tax=Neobacillus sp. GCM10023253 TaxID=3252644 RepID=UPI00360946EC